VYLRNPVDVEMVMDVSDTMNYPSPADPAGDTKLAMMKQATTMITDFLKDHGQSDDRMGLVWFTDDASEYQNGLGQKLLPIQANWTDLKAQITAQETGVCTAMGAGMQKAFDTLSASTNQRFAILCTDGMQNIEPKVEAVGGHYEIIDSDGWLCGGHSSVAAHPGTDITSYNTRVHTIGVGITATYASLLQDIANATGAFYRGTDDPSVDLDLIYFLDLCNCMAGGSPAVVHHSAGTLISRACEAVEEFQLNRSARKISVLLSWKKSQGSNLTFWLYAPDGSLLDLQGAVKQFENYTMATVYLPKQQDGKTLAHVGQWRMIIRGETHGPSADYHAMVIAEDQELKWHVDFPRKMYEVGDILPIRLRLAELKRPITKVNEITMEMAHLRLPLTEILPEYRISHYELRKREKSGKSRKEPLLLKLEALESDWRHREALKPVRTNLSMQKGSLECKINKEEIIIPVVLKQPGFCSFKIAIHCETAENGPVSRVDLVSVHVSAGSADPKQSRVSLFERTEGGPGAQLRIVPRSEKGHLLGPGLSHEFKAMLGKEPLALDVEDLLDGGYQLEFISMAKEQEKAKRGPVRILFQNKLIWEGVIK
jgi:hypothetical protein